MARGRTCAPSEEVERRLFTRCRRWPERCPSFSVMGRWCLLLVSICPALSDGLGMTICLDSDSGGSKFGGRVWPGGSWSVCLVAVRLRLYPRVWSQARCCCCCRWRLRQTSEKARAAVRALDWTLDHIVSCGVASLHDLLLKLTLSQMTGFVSETINNGPPISFVFLWSCPRRSATILS